MRGLLSSSQGVSPPSPRGWDAGCCEHHTSSQETVTKEVREVLSLRAYCVLGAPAPRPQVLFLHSLRKPSSLLYTVGSSTHFPDEKRRGGKSSGGVRTSLLTLPWDSAALTPHLPVLPSLPTFPVTSSALQLSRDDVLSGPCNHLPPTPREHSRVLSGNERPSLGGGPVKPNPEVQGSAQVQAGQGRPQPRRAVL